MAVVAEGGRTVSGGQCHLEPVWSLGWGITAGGGTPHPPSFSGSRQGFPPSSGGRGILSCSPKGVGGPEAGPHGGPRTRSEESR